jgi:predicted metalloendopeptidase
MVVWLRGHCAHPSWKKLGNLVGIDALTMQLTHHMHTSTFTNARTRTQKCTHSCMHTRTETHACLHADTAPSLWLITCMYGAAAFFGWYVDADSHHPDRRAFFLAPGGMTLPDKSYYTEVARPLAIACLISCVICMLGAKDPSAVCHTLRTSA